MRKQLLRQRNDSAIKWNMWATTYTAEAVSFARPYSQSPFIITIMETHNNPRMRLWKREKNYFQLFFPFIGLLREPCLLSDFIRKKGLPSAVRVHSSFLNMKSAKLLRYFFLSFIFPLKLLATKALTVTNNILCSSFLPCFDESNELKEEMLLLLMFTYPWVHLSAERRSFVVIWTQWAVDNNRIRLKKKKSFNVSVHFCSGRYPFIFIFVHFLPIISSEKPKWSRAQPKTQRIVITHYFIVEAI